MSAAGLHRGYVTSSVVCTGHTFALHLLQSNHIHSSPRSTIAYRLNNHLGNTLSTQRLAAHEVLSFHGGNRIKDPSEEQQHSSGNQASGVWDNAQPLHDASSDVERGPSPEGLKPSDEGVERRRRRADTKQKGDLEEDDEETGHDRENRKDDLDVEMEDIRDAHGEAYDDRDDSSPLSVYTEVPCPELLSNSIKHPHFCGVSFQP